MKIMLHGQYSGKSFVLRNENGTVYKAISPHSIFMVENGVAWYYARKIIWGRKRMIALIRISGSQKNLPLRELREITQFQKGCILKPGRGYLATSSNSARNGVWKIELGIENPITISLKNHDIPLKILTVVNEIETTVYSGGNLCRHNNGPGAYSYNYYSDGNTGVLRGPVYVNKSKTVEHQQCQSREATICVIGGTYCLQTLKIKARNGKSYTNIKRIVITEQTDKKEVASIINKIME